MAKINILTKEIYNQISAGEVVERPASIVKELFENSIDAGATCITVGIENGGINSIYVQDDGFGIEKNEIEKVFMPHATSKISTQKDLNSILTLGFRGEAMSSIASVSKVKLVTKTDDAEIGSYITIEGGSVVDSGEIQAEKGTKITVTGIFYNTPARLKFLKTPKSEEGEITSLMEKLILANPNVAVKYFVNSKLVFQSYGDGLKNALVSVYSKNTVENCTEISTVKNGILIEGFLGNINFYKSNKSYQTLIVNGRCVTDNTVASAVHNAYSVYLMKRQYPFYVLSLTLPPEVVDVNVHPRKSEIRFQNNQIVYGTIYNVVSKVINGLSEAIEIIKSTSVTKEPDEYYEKLKEDGIKAAQMPETVSNLDKEYEKLLFTSDKEISKIEDDKPKYTAKSYIDDNGKIVYKDYDKTIYKSKGTGLSDHLKKIDSDFTDPTYLAKCEADDIFAENKRYLEEQELAKANEQKLEINEELEFVGQIFGTYLIFEYKTDVFIVDQHAAHERVLYDTLLEKAKNREVVSQQLLIPYHITVNAKEHDLIFELLDYLQDMGFDVGYYDERSYRVYTVPAGFEDMNVERFFFDIISDKNLQDEKIPTVIREKLMQKACKSAIKAGDRLAETEIDALMCKLKSDFSLKCPHGRPVAVRISKTEVDKWFKRIL